MGKMASLNVAHKSAWSDEESAISMIVPTFRRPDGLKTALESLKLQDAGQRKLELIVADNDPEGSAKGYVEWFTKQVSFPVKYIHVPQPGVANARNEALKVANGRYLAFLDDDQFASENWLSELLSAMETHGAGLAFCPTFAQSPVEVEHKGQCLDFFTRDIMRAETGEIDSFFGCGNALLDRHICKLPDPVFSLETNETGGEDDLLFSYIKAHGAKIVWTSQTSAGEDVQDWRMTHKYIRVRSFAYGQGPSRICANPDAFNLWGLLRWMFIGVGQFCVYAPLALLSKIFAKDKYIPFMRKASEGAGKALWFERFRPKIYGATALKLQLKREHAAKGAIKVRSSKA